MKITRKVKRGFTFANNMSMPTALGALKTQEKDGWKIEDFSLGEESVTITMAKYVTEEATVATFDRDFWASVQASDNGYSYKAYTTMKAMGYVFPNQASSGASYNMTSFLELRKQLAAKDITDDNKS